MLENAHFFLYHKLQMHNDFMKKNTQSGFDEVAIQEIKKHIPKQSNAFQMV